MFVRTQRLVITKTLQDKILAALVNAAPSAILDVTAKVLLYTAGPQPTETSVVGDFTEATFTGYAAVTLASVLGPMNMTSKNRGDHKEIDFLSSADTSPAQDIQGILITDSAKAVLLAAEAFDTPVGIAQSGDGVSYDLILAPGSPWGGAS